MEHALKPKMANVPDDKYNLLIQLLSHATTIDALKVQLDLNGFNYDKKNELNFLKWLWKIASFQKGKCYQYAIDAFIYKKYKEKINEEPTTYDDITMFKSVLRKKCLDSYKQWYEFYATSKVVTPAWKLKKIILSYAKQHIAELVPNDLADRWLKMKLCMHKGKNSFFNDFRDTLLYYWTKHGLKKHPASSTKV